MGDTLECPTKDFKNAAAAEKKVAVYIPAELPNSINLIYGVTGRSK